MSLTAQKVENALLAHNFFPRVAMRGDEFPPCFVSVGFTAAIASKLISSPIKRVEGYGTAAARSTRYDLAPRNLEISHPMAFAAIARHLKTSWNEWKFVVSNPSSAIRVSEHADGRVFSMVTISDSESLVRPGGRFRATVDISNFYGSIYTHALPWAVDGLHAAKANQSNKNNWANQLDMKLRHARRRETTGISVGPGTSGAIGEILLGKVDQSLRDQGYEFYRFIDDYFFVGTTRDRAEAFIRAVRDELSQLKLAIHPGKTTISELPNAISPRWMRTLRTALRGGVGRNRLLDALDEAIEGSDTDPEDGALRYVLVSLEDVFSGDDILGDVREAIVNRLLSIGYLRPIAIGTACRMLSLMGTPAIAARTTDLDLILQEHVSALRTDSATWILHTLLAHDLVPSQASVEAIVKSGDCLAMTLLTEADTLIASAAKFIENLEKESPPDYRRDEYWLLYYQLAYRKNLVSTVPSAYYDEFKPLLDAHVSFIDLTSDNPYRPFHGSGSTGPTTGSGPGRRPYFE